MALLLVLASLIAWEMWRRGKIFGHENGAVWGYRPAKAADVSHPGAARPDRNPGNAILPPNTNSLPDPAAANTPDLTGKPLKKPSAAMRLPLARPVRDTAATADAPPRRQKRHRRGILGLGKLWHWIRRDQRKNKE